MIGSADAGGVRTPPACVYRDDARFAAEQAAIFRRSWLVAGLAADVAAPGDYTTVDLDGVPVVVCRDEDGRLHALANVCQHRGMVVAEGSGRARTLNCPNHAWVYGLDGQLRGAPRTTREADFDCAAIRLPRFAVHEWGPLLLVNLDPAAQPRLGATLRAFEQRTGLPVVINTSLNTAGRPMVDDPRDALELFGSAPVDLLVLGPHLVRRSEVFAQSDGVPA